ncbi:MAG TPA: Mu transposase C-terminal domain-containing protein [Streptosporangiaceae bacterium]|nr:Mu transposase C-terminal domain-containing protein [Streptosporangiaceae bacterium]
MSAARRRGVGVGDRVLAGGVPNVVVSVSGTHVRLADDAGRVQTVTAAELGDSTRFSVGSGEPSRGPRPDTGLEGMPAAAVEEASWWEAHIAEVVYGLRPDAPAGTRPRPQYDPERTSLTERERAKAAELSAEGKPVPASTVKHRRQRWEAYGLPGLADRRLSRRKRPAGRTDERVVAAMAEAIVETENASSRTTGFTIWRTKEILGEAGYDGPLPTDRTLYRLFGTLSHGRHVTGPASTRRSLAGRPDGMFGSVPAAAPGEVVQIDSTPLDVLVLLDDGVPGRVELTAMIDVATRVVPAAVLRPTTKDVDAGVLLARAMTPEPARPGWPEALKMAHSVLPYERLLDIDSRLEQAAARPVIVPSTVVIDHGAAFISAGFRSACRHLGISVQPAHLGSGSEKGHVERFLGSVASLFCQFASGYAGRSPDRRGRHVEDQPLWSVAELQELLDEWLVAFWLNRRNDGLRDPEHPGRAFTPNEKYAALVEASGYLPVALTAGDYIELLPAEWRRVNAYGIRLARRSYDSEELNPLRLQPSGISEHDDRWEIRHDPYDISKIHVRGPDGWITVFWKHLDRAPLPFGELAWDHAARSLGREATEEQIADAVTALLRRADAGPEEKGKPKMSKRDRRVAARTKATAPAAGPQDPPEPAAEPEPPVPDEDGNRDGPLAKVIPMPAFDPFAEADKRW